MVNEYKKDLTAFVRDIEIDFEGQPVKRGTHLQLASLKEKDLKQFRSIIRSQIYHECYCRLRFATRIDLMQNLYREDFGKIDKEFLQALKDANQFIKPIQTGWTLENKFSNGSVNVKKNQERRLIPAGDYLFDQFNTNLASNQKAVSIRAYADHFTDASIFHFIFGENYQSTNYPYLIRFYFNMKAAFASELVTWLSGNLNKLTIPFQFKSPASPEYYTRADAGVLYIENRYFRLVKDLISEHKDMIKPLLNSGTPLFTYQLTEGIGIAQQPTNGSSFGMNISEMLTEGIIYCLYEKIPVHDWETHFEALFLRYNTSLTEPYANKGSSFYIN